MKTKTNGFKWLAYAIGTSVILFICYYLLMSIFDNAITAYYSAFAISILGVLIILRYEKLYAEVNAYLSVMISSLYVILLTIVARNNISVLLFWPAIVISSVVVIFAILNIYLNIKAYSPKGTRMTVIIRIYAQFFIQAAVTCLLLFVFPMCFGSID